MTHLKEKLQNGLGVNQSKVDYFDAQLKQLYEYLKDKAVTASFAERETGIKQKNITRFKRILEKKGQLKEVKKVFCPITRHLAWEITTDPTQFPKESQRNLFDND